MFDPLLIDFDAAGRDCSESVLSGAIVDAIDIVRPELSEACIGGDTVEAILIVLDWVAGAGAPRATAGIYPFDGGVSFEDDMRLLGIILPLIV